LESAEGRRGGGGHEAEAGAGRGNRRPRQLPARTHADGARSRRRAAAEDLPGRARRRRAPLRRDQRQETDAPRRHPDRRRRCRLPYLRGRRRGVTGVRQRRAKPPEQRSTEMRKTIHTLNPDRPKRLLILASNPAVSGQTGWPIGFWWAELT